MAAAASEQSESMKTSTDDSAMEVSVNENNTIQLSDLKVPDLRAELEKRDLDKSGVKSVLIERLKNALMEEGEDPEEFSFKEQEDAGNTKSSVKKKKIPDTETNGEVDACEEILEEAPAEAKKTSVCSEDKNINEVTLQISIDEEEAQLNEDENMDTSKVSDSESDMKPVEEPNALNCDVSVEDNSQTVSQEPPTVQSTPVKTSKSINEDTKEKKVVKATIPLKTTEVSGAVSPKVLKVIGKNDKIKSANVLAKSLWITGLPNTTRAADLKTLFSKQGRVLSVKIVKSTKQTPGKCYGFITMATSKDATKAIQNLHRIELNGRIISVERTQSDPSALLKKTESKVVTLSSKKSSVKKETVKTSESAKSTSSEPKATTKSDAKVIETKAAEEPAKPKEEKTKPSEKPKSKERDQKSRDHKDRDTRRSSVRKPPPSRPRPFNFNERPRFGGVRRPFRSRPFAGRSRFGSNGFRPRQETSVYDRMREERVRRDRLREREAERRRLDELDRHRVIERRQREEAFRLEREKEKLRLERELLERERAEMLTMEREKQRLERERLERERDELRRQAELRQVGKRPFSRTTREASTFWDARKKASPRFEERSTFHAEKIRLEPSTSSRYELPSRDRSSFSRHEFERRPERFSTPKVLEPAPRAEFGDRDSRREVTIRTREERPVFERNNFRDRDNRRSFPTRERPPSRREGSREDWKHDRRVHERVVAPSSSSVQRRMTYY